MEGVFSTLWYTIIKEAYLTASFLFRARYDRCMLITEKDSRQERCSEYKRRAYTAMDLYDTKYGDLAYNANAISVLQVCYSGKRCKYGTT